MFCSEGYCLLFRVIDGQHCICPSGTAPPVSSTATTVTPATSERELSCDCYNNKDGEEQLRHKLVQAVGDDTLSFIKSKEEFKRQMNFTGMIYRLVQNIIEYCKDTAHLNFCVYLITVLVLLFFYDIKHVQLSVIMLEFKSWCSQSCFV